METQTIEGTWKEIIQHLPELSGQRVRVTILSSTLKPPFKLDQLLHDRIGVVNFQPDDLYAFLFNRYWSLRIRNIFNRRIKCSAKIRCLEMARFSSFCSPVKAPFLGFSSGSWFSQHPHKLYPQDMPAQN